MPITIQGRRVRIASSQVKAAMTRMRPTCCVDVPSCPGYRVRNGRECYTSPLRNHRAVASRAAARHRRCGAMNFGFRIDPQALWARQNITLSLMLLALHFALMVDLGSGPARALLLTHFGLFLLWQPVWQGTERLEPGRAALLVAGGALLVWWSSWWLIALWLAVLFSLIGGNVPAMRSARERFASLLAALYLLAMLLVWVVPKLFQAREFSALAVATVRYGLLVPLVTIPFLHAEVRRDRPRYAIDLVYSVLLFLLVVVLVLGAFFVQQVSHGDYPMALAQTLTGDRGAHDDPVVAVGSARRIRRHRPVAVTLLPEPRACPSSAGCTASPIGPSRNPIRTGSCRRRSRRCSSCPGCRGSSGPRATSADRRARPAARGTAFTFGGLTLRLYTKWRPSPALMLHMRLLARLLADYHEAKVREEVQRRTAYLQAIYETGSRLTHDVKNLLQSLALAVLGGRDERQLRRRGVAAPDPAPVAADHAAPAVHAGQARRASPGPGGAGVGGRVVARARAALRARGHRVRHRPTAAGRAPAGRIVRQRCRQPAPERAGEAAPRRNQPDRGGAALRFDRVPADRSPMPDRRFRTRWRASSSPRRCRPTAVSASVSTRAPATPSELGYVAATGQQCAGQRSIRPRGDESGCRPRRPESGLLAGRDEAAEQHAGRDPDQHVVELGCRQCPTAGGSRTPDPDRHSPFRLQTSAQVGPVSGNRRPCSVYNAVLADRIDDGDRRAVGQRDARGAVGRARRRSRADDEQVARRCAAAVAIVRHAWRSSCRRWW